MELQLLDQDELLDHRILGALVALDERDQLGSNFLLAVQRDPRVDLVGTGG